MGYVSFMCTTAGILNGKLSRMKALQCSAVQCSAFRFRERKYSIALFSAVQCIAVCVSAL